MMSQDVKSIQSDPAINSEQKFDFKDLDDVPIDGSLGLLAYGYKGIMIWREKKINSTFSSLPQ